MSATRTTASSPRVPRARELSSDAVTDLRLILDYLAPREEADVADVIFCFGSRDLAVPATAAGLYAAGVAPWVLVTGGSRGRTTHPTESEAFAAALAARGVPPERTILEPLAANTGENVAFGMRALAERGVAVRRAVLVAWPLSTRRSSATFACAFPGVRTYACPSSCAFPRAGEALLDLALAELWRLRLYPELGYIAAQEIPDEVREAEERLTVLTSPRAELAIA